MPSSRSASTASAPQVYVINDKHELSQAVAEYVLQAQAEGLKRHNKFKVALSGGSLVAVLREGLVGRDDVQWGKWEIFFADERVVPLSDPDSNYGLVKKELLDHIPADKPKPTVFTIDESQLDDTQEVADEYEKVLIKSFAAKDTVKIPIFDLILLGAGPDGHTCSLFPNHEVLRETTAWVAPVEDSPKPPPKRITLTLPVVQHALKIAFVATGSGKAPILKTVFEEPEKGLPCSLVNEHSLGSVTWFVDGPAVKDVGVMKKAWKI